MRKILSIVFIGLGFIFIFKYCKESGSDTISPFDTTSSFDTLAPIDTAAPIDATVYVESEAISEDSGQLDIAGVGQIPSYDVPYTVTLSNEDAYRITYRNLEWVYDTINDAHQLDIGSFEKSMFLFEDKPPAYIDWSNLENLNSDSVVLTNVIIDTIAKRISFKQRMPNRKMVNIVILYNSQTLNNDTIDLLKDVVDYEVGLSNDILRRNRVGLEFVYPTPKFINASSFWQKLKGYYNTGARKIPESLFSALSQNGIYNSDQTNLYYIFDDSYIFGSRAFVDNNIAFIGNESNQYTLLHELIHNCYECMGSGNGINHLDSCQYSTAVMSTYKNHHPLGYTT